MTTLTSRLRNPSPDTMIEAMSEAADVLERVEAWIEHERLTGLPWRIVRANDLRAILKGEKP